MIESKDIKQFAKFFGIAFVAISILFLIGKFAPWLVMIF